MPPAHSPSRLILSLRVIFLTTSLARSSAARYSSRPHFPSPRWGLGFRQTTMNTWMPWLTANSTSDRPGERSMT